MKTIHIILNSHIDPIWLWPWQAGLDAALATCRSACDRLDAHKDLYFNRGEAWIYQQIQLVDPPLFKRIKKHVESGRWNIVGGWWIQPDCNQPSGFAMRKQIELGRDYFQKTFGRFPKTAYNVDSFGHAASLPQLMHDAGQSRYVMMRPQEHELKLPARLFRWRGYENDPPVTTFRIAGAYVTWTAEVSEHVLASTTQLPPGIDHTMCFIGVGDHGGGPTEAQIEYLKQHRDALDGWRLKFSTPDRFFDAITPQIESLPIVTGELQFHAVGCYTVQREVKTNVRHAEHLLAQAEIVVAHSGVRPRAGTATLLHDAWRDVCLHHFHDTLGGTCIPSAYKQVNAQLGRAAATADELIHHTFRRKLAKLKPDPMQRMALFNASDDSFDQYLTLAPWMEGRNMSPTARVLDADGNRVPHQIVPAESLTHGSLEAAMLMRATLEPHQLAIYRIALDGGGSPKPDADDASVRGFALHSSPDLSCGDDLQFPFGRLAIPHLALFDDLSDTWGHGVSRFSDTPANVARFNAPVIIARGPLMAAKTIDGQIGSSRIRAEWRVHKGDPFIELRLMIVFVGRHKMLKLILPLPAPSGSRNDGIMNGHLARLNDGIERPVRDWTRIDCNNESQLAIVAPDCYALDCNGSSVRFSLIRSPLMAHHIPHQPSPWRGWYADQGRHEFRFWFCYGPSIDLDDLNRRALAAHRPPVFADLTAGMSRK